MPARSFLSALLTALLVLCPRASVASGRPLFQAPACITDVLEESTLDQALDQMALGDITGDGRPDLVVVIGRSPGPPTINWDLAWLANQTFPGGPRLFTSMSAPPGYDPFPPPGPRQVALGDLNGDGRADLITRDVAGTQVRVQLSSATGALQASNAYTPAGAASVDQILVGDMDNDGLLDICSMSHDTTSATSTFTVFRNTGAGALQRIAPPSIVSIPNGSWATLGDLNHDGFPDVVTVQPSSSSFVRIYLSTGPLSFAAPNTITTGGGVASAAIARMDSDPEPDLALLVNTSAICIHHGAGGGFIPSAHDTYPVQANTFEMTAADLDQDGWIELITGVHTSSPFDQKYPGHSIEIVDMKFPFGPYRFLDPGVGVGKPIAADLDGDGAIDLAAPLWDDREHNVAVMLGPIGSGTGLVPLGLSGDLGSVGSPCVADFNRDGNPDFAAPFQSTTYVRLGDGTGGFAIAPNTSAIATDRLFTCDLNRDAKPDLVHTSVSAFTTQLGNGDGTFQSPVSGIYVTVLPPRHPFADMNRDGIEDMLFMNPGTGPEVFAAIGNGTGGFSGEAFETGLGFGPPRDAVAVDLDGDGDLDVAVATGNGIDLWMSDGVSAMTYMGTLGGGSDYRTIASGDLDRDGKPDLLAHKYLPIPYDHRARGIDIYYMDGSFGVARRDSTGANERDGAMLEAWPVNSDGLPDIVCVARDNLRNPYQAATLGVSLQASPGVFAPRLDFQQGYVPTDGFTVAADLDGDLQPDVIGFSGAPSQPFVTISLGNRDPWGWSVSSPRNYAVGASPFGLTAGDLNRDGITDLVSADNQTNLSVLLGTSSGGFGPAATIPSPGATRPALADFNRDGKLDLAVAHGATGGPLSIRFGAGDGTFGAPTFYTPGAGVFLKNLDIADFNRDGKPDVVVTGSQSNAYVYLDDAGGSLTLASIIAVGSGSGVDLAAADVNRDGKQDLVLVDLRGSSARLYVALGKGDGNFGGLALAAGVSGTVTAIATGDLNKDGSPDIILAVTGGSGNRLAVLFGTGSGSFSPEIDYPTHAGTNFLTLGYLNSDRWLDVVSSSETDGVVSIRLGTGSGNLGAPMEAQQTAPTEGVKVADVDRDGKNDVVFCYSAGAASTASVLLNASSTITAAPVTRTPSIVPLLAQNAPNPFNPRTTIRFVTTLPGRVRLNIFDVTGRRVRTLLDGLEPSGEHRVEWDGLNQEGGRVASGLYFYQMEAGPFRSTRRMALLR